MKRLGQSRLSRQQLDTLAIVMFTDPPPWTLDILRVLRGPAFDCRRADYERAFASMIRSLRRLERRELVIRDGRRWRLARWGHVPLVDKEIIYAVPC
jgi:hypothetical protein